MPSINYIILDMQQRTKEIIDIKDNTIRIKTARMQINNIKEFLSFYYCSLGINNISYELQENLYNSVMDAYKDAEELLQRELNILENIINNVA